MVLCHPIILPSTKAYPWSFVSENKVELYTLQPGPTVQFAPMTTLGPIYAVGSTLAVSWIRASPLILSPEASILGDFSFNDYK